MKKKNTKHASAKVAGGKLILSLPHAVKPTVWQMDLSALQSSALEVEEQDNVFELCMKVPAGEDLVVASFESKGDAVSALMEASSAMEQSHHVSSSSSSSSSAGRDVSSAGRGRGRWIGPVLALLLLIALIVVWSSLAPLDIDPAALSSGGASAVSGGPVSGVPMSADDFLQAQ